MHIIHEEIGFPRIVSSQQDDKTASFTISPLPSGYGMTLGNALRRVLLSSVPGSAITAIRIDGASHEYTTVSGMKDSVLHLLLNLKRVAIKKHSKDPEIVKLDHQGEGEVTAKEIKTAGDTAILNPDYVITTLDKKNSKLSLELKIEKGVGYSPAKEREKDNESGWILIDAIFSPVIRVKYDVSPVRVGDMTNLDKLNIEVETNGAIEPEESLKFAAQIVESYFNLFKRDESEFIEKDFVADFDSQTASSEAIDNDDEKEAYTPVEILDLSPRTLNALINNDIGSVEELVECTESKLDTMRGFGKKAMTEVKDALANRGLKLIDSN
jgi:DNA-directed RNA polymerase subunit alpha